MGKGKEGVDYFKLGWDGRDWQPPVKGSESFIYEEISFYWNDEEQYLSYPYGAAHVSLEISTEEDFPGFFGPRGRGSLLTVEVDGIEVLTEQEQTDKIEDPALRTAVEIGLRAWQAQLDKSTYDALAALRKTSS